MNIYRNMLQYIVKYVQGWVQNSNPWMNQSPKCYSILYSFIIVTISPSNEFVVESARIRKYI